MLSFFSSRRNWNSPTPLAAGECAPPPFDPGGGHTRLREGVGGVPIPTRGHKLWCSIYISTLWGRVIKKGEGAREEQEEGGGRLGKSVGGDGG